MRAARDDGVDGVVDDDDDDDNNDGDMESGVRERIYVSGSGRTRGVEWRLYDGILVRVRVMGMCMCMSVYVFCDASIVLVFA